MAACVRLAAAGASAAGVRWRVLTSFSATAAGQGLGRGRLVWLDRARTARASTGVGLLVPDRPHLLHQTWSIPADAPAEPPLRQLQAGCHRCLHPTGAIAEPFVGGWPAAARLSTRSKNRDARFAGGRSAPRWALWVAVATLSGRCPWNHQPLIQQQPITICNRKAGMLRSEGRGAPWAGKRSALDSQLAGLRPCARIKPWIVWRRNLLAGRGGFGP